MSKIDDLEHEVVAERVVKRERSISDEKYAPMIVKTIVYSTIGIILMGFMSFLLIKIGWS